MNAVSSTCAGSLCPLNRVRAGLTVRIKSLHADPAQSQRLREIGLGEEQLVRLVASSTNLICQVCNARFALSAQLAGMILVEPLVPARAA
jgi:Fe2+ transport system protein FeoA